MSQKKNGRSILFLGVVGSSSHRFRKPRRERIAENVEASTAEKIKKLFKVLTKGDKPIAIEDLTKKIVESKITTYGSEEIIENIKQASMKILLIHFVNQKGDHIPKNFEFPKHNLSFKTLIEKYSCINPEEKILDHLPNTCNMFYKQPLKNWYL